MRHGRAPNTDPKNYQEYTVIKPLPNTVTAEIAAWGSSSGGGTQYELPRPIKQLIKEGYLVPK
ncbi:TNT domain-containing protein [Lactococcus paracarnosus]|uniref:TNT domain-containing protein n=1 Tax=Pseudolactococcus paracarnosus TaxID=2749962 RepID=A0ABT0ALE9_9LACT|nr:TNT domain-containing protein [Lactococcus paracarnosus]MCJ1983490.1 TNT domain-containing protein [Lactococcus paracarnosus]MCJ1998156.1 TNT domain-containing protein [Lactococcus paracarnosus]